MAGKITLSVSNNETRVEWKINHFFIREDNLIVSPDFILFQSKWFLQLHLGRKLTFFDTKNDSCESLRMSLLTLNPTTQYHIEYRMGIQLCNGSEIITDKFELLLNKGFNQTPQRRKLISRKDFKRSRNTLVTENTLGVFCTVRLISAVNPDRDVSSIISSDSDFSSSLLLFCDEREMAGEITLVESKTETRIEWRINDFSNRKDWRIESPDFVFCNSKWFLGIQNISDFIKSFSKLDRVSDSFLHMSIEKLYPHTEISVEYAMGIHMSNGFEIRTEKLEWRGSELFPEKIITPRKSVESFSDILDFENTLKVFCTMRLSDNISPGGISLLDNLSYFLSMKSDGTIVGEVTLDKSKNETRIEWTINHFFARGDILIKSPDFILFMSKWFLQITRNNNIYSKKSLCMYIQRDFYSTAEHHIEYRMGIKRPDGSEIITETFKSVFQPRYKKILPKRELISENYLKKLGHTLTHENTLKVFCTVRLLNDNPAVNVTSSISSTYGAGTSYENPQNASLTKGFFSLNNKAEGLHLTKANSTLNTNNEVSSSTKGIFKFGETIKGSGASHENFKSISQSEGIRTLSENFQDLHLTKDISTQTENSEVPWVPKFVFKFGEEFNGVATSSGKSKDVCLNKGIHTFSKNFEDLYQSKRFTDVTIKVKDKEFLVHKMILSTRSEVFASMFEHDTSEKRSNVVDITDCDPHSFENFLLYLYTGKLDTVSSSNAVSLFKTADKYGVEELKIECVQCMVQKMTVGSFCDIFHLAVLHGESDLLSTATNFFIRNASAILITKEWLTLLEEHTSLCNELLVKFAKSSSELSFRHSRLGSRNLRDHRT